MSAVIDRLQRKIDRAMRHVTDARRSIREFLDSKPYSVTWGRDPETRRLIYFVQSMADIPAEIPLIVGDALHNLRSTLDHLAWELVIANSGQPSKQTAYPIFDAADKYAANHHGKTKGMSSAAIKLIDSTKPYKGGDERFWILHELDIIDKHRRLNIVVSQFQAVNIGRMASRNLEKLVNETWGKDKVLPKIDLFLRPAKTYCPVKVGDVLFAGIPDGEPDEDLQFNFDVAFAELDLAHGKPVAEALNEFVNLVKETVQRFAQLT